MVAGLEQAFSITVSVPVVTLGFGVFSITIVAVITVGLGVLAVTIAITAVSFVAIAVAARL